MPAIINNKIKTQNNTICSSIKNMLSVLPKLMYRFNVLNKKPSLQFLGTGKLSLKLIWKCKGPRIDKQF